MFEDPLKSQKYVFMKHYQNFNYNIDTMLLDDPSKILKSYKHNLKKSKIENLKIVKFEDV